MNHGTTSLRSLVYASMFGALTAVGAFLSIPLYPVPVTLQTMFMTLAALLLGGPVGAMSQVVYVLLGLIGLPVFAGGKAGLGVLAGPTGGYLVGFVAGAFVIGSVARLRKRPGAGWLVASIIAGHLVMYCLGVVQLSLVAHLSLTKAVMVGVLPFLPGDALKYAASILICFKVRQHLKALGTASG